MRPIVWITAPCVALLAGWLALGGISNAQQNPAASCDVWLHEPLVAYDAVGSTFAGPFDESLHVYNDGVVKYFSLSRGKAALVYLSPAQTRALAQDLFQAGAFALCDDPLGGADVPLKTLTLFRGKADAPTHTVNWWGGSPSYTPFEQIIDGFVAAHVP